MNQVDKAKEFYKNFMLPQKTTKLAADSNSKQSETSKGESFLARLFGKKYSDDFDSKSNAKPENEEEIVKKYEQDLQLAYYSDLEEFKDMLSKRDSCYLRSFNHLFARDQKSEAIFD